MHNIRKTTCMLVVFLLSIVAVCLINSQAFATKIAPEVEKLIKEVTDKDSYVESGALILLKETTMNVDKDGLYTITTHVIGKILNEQAASEYSQIQKYFNSFYEDIHLDFALTICKDGSIKEISNDALEIKTQPFLENYTDEKILAFSLPALEKGAYFEYKVTRTQKKAIIKNRWFDNFKFHLVHYDGKTVRIDPVYKSIFTLVIPEQETFIYQMKNSQVSPLVRTNKETKTYIWEMNDLEYVPTENTMPNVDEIIPTLYLSSVKSWEEIDEWVNNIFSPKIEVSSEIQETVRKITTGVSTDEEKIKAIFYYIEKEIKYIQAHLSRGGYTPHSPDETLNTKYGDCKDQVILFLSMLKSIGITGYPALINPVPYDSLNRDIPAQWFSHVIIYIPRVEGDMWLDTTAGISTFSPLMWLDQGIWAFVIDGKGGKFIKTPSSNAEHNKANISVEHFMKDGKQHRRFIIQAEGAQNDNLKFLFKMIPLKNRQEVLRKIIESQYPLVPETIETKISDIEEPDQTFEVNAMAIWKKTEIENKFLCYGSLVLLESFFPNLFHIPTAIDRKNDFMLFNEYKFNIEHICNSPAPEYQVKFVPQDKIFENRLISYSTRFKKEGQTIKIKTEITFKQKRVKKDEYKEFYESVQKIREDSLWQIEYEKGKIDEKEKYLHFEIEKNPENANAILNLAKHYLIKAKYEEALKLLEKAVVLSPQNGEIHYFIGLSLGYLDKNDESQRAFKKAKELGYKP